MLLTEFEIRSWDQKSDAELDQMLAETKAQIRTARDVRDEAEARHQTLEGRGSALQQYIARRKLAKGTTPTTAVSK